MLGRRACGLGLHCKAKAAAYTACFVIVAMSTGSGVEYLSITSTTSKHHQKLDV